MNFMKDYMIMRKANNQGKKYVYMYERQNFLMFVMFMCIYVYTWYYKYCHVKI